MAAAATSNDLPLFKRLNNAQDPSTVARIFSQGRRLVRDPEPTFILLVGSPGAGKTSQLPTIIQRILGKDDQQFYEVSLDRLAERVEPYRELTQRFHRELVSRRQPAPLTNEDIGLLGEIYLPMIKSTASNFSLTAKEHASMKKLEESLMTGITTASSATASSSSKSSSKRAARSLGKRRTMNSRKSYQPGTKTRSKRASTDKSLKSLADMVWVGLEHGVQQGYNIVYDTTFDGNFAKLKDHIMPMLEAHMDTVKYRILVIHVKAPAQVIEERLRSRFMNMVDHTPWIRAVDPRRAELFRKKNQEGYDKAKAYFMEQKIYDHLRNRKYTHHDFEFMEYENIPVSKSFDDTKSFTTKSFTNSFDASRYNNTLYNNTSPYALPSASSPSVLLAESISALTLEKEDE